MLCILVYFNKNHGEDNKNGPAFFLSKENRFHKGSDSGFFVLFYPCYCFFSQVQSLPSGLVLFSSCRSDEDILMIFWVTVGVPVVLTSR